MTDHGKGGQRKNSCSSRLFKSSRTGGLPGCFSSRSSRVCGSATRCEGWRRRHLDDPIYP
jgi:hypothetical protein